MFLDEKMNGWPGLPAKYTGRWDVAVQRFYLLGKKKKTKPKQKQQKKKRLVLSTTEIGLLFERIRQMTSTPATLSTAGLPLGWISSKEASQMATHLVGFFNAYSTELN